MVSRVDVKWMGTATAVLFALLLMSQASTGIGFGADPVVGASRPIAEIRADINVVMAQYKSDIADANERWTVLQDAKSGLRPQLNADIQASNARQAQIRADVTAARAAYRTGAIELRNRTVEIRSALATLRSQYYAAARGATREERAALRAQYIQDRNPLVAEYQQLSAARRDLVATYRQAVGAVNGQLVAERAVVRELRAQYAVDYAAINNQLAQERQTRRDLYDQYNIDMGVLGQEIVAAMELEAAQQAD